MKKLLIISALIISSAIQAKDVYEAIAIVESQGNDNAVGDKGKAIGRYQLWEVYVLDVNRISKKKYCSDDRKDPAKSLEMVKIYTGYYCERYTRLTGKEATAETIARVHNGGPNGWKKQATDKYWNKIKREMETCLPKNRKKSI
jgi:hypothetical protein